jgi:hypothetical protein
MTDQSERALRKVIQEFVFAPNWQESRWALQVHPELLTEETDSLLSSIKTSAREMGRTHDAELADTHQKLLRLSRGIGPKAAFAQLTGYEGPPLSPELNDLYNAAAEADESFRATGNIQHLPKAVAAAEVGIERLSTQLDRAPLETLEYIYSSVITLQTHYIAKMHRGEDLGAALALWNKLLDRTNGSIHDLSPRCSSVGGGLLLVAYLEGRHTLPAAIEALKHGVSASQPGADYRPGAVKMLEYAQRLSSEQ